MMNSSNESDFLTLNPDTVGIRIMQKLFKLWKNFIFLIKLKIYFY